MYGVFEREGEVFERKGDGEGIFDADLPLLPYGEGLPEFEMCQIRRIGRCVKRSGFSGVPQVEINGKIIIGFDKKAIDKELGF
jgi:hypothetical protein